MTGPALDVAIVAACFTVLAVIAGVVSVIQVRARLKTLEERPRVGVPSWNHIHLASGTSDLSSVLVGMQRSAEWVRLASQVEAARADFDAAAPHNVRGVR